MVERVQVIARVPPKLDREIERRWQRERKAAGGASVSKNDVLIALLRAGLAAASETGRVAR